MRCSDLVAVARIARRRAAADSYTITYSGDGLRGIQAPATVWLYFPAYHGADLSRILATVNPELDPAGSLASAELITLRVGDHGRGAVRIRSAAGPDLCRAWICRPKADLIAEGGVYVFELIGLPVCVSPDEPAQATVAAYSESSAHGLLHLRMLSDGREILVPYVDDLVETDLAHGRLIVPRLADFLELE